MNTCSVCTGQRNRKSNRRQVVARVFRLKPVVYQQRDVVHAVTKRWYHEGTIWFFARSNAAKLHLFSWQSAQFANRIPHQILLRSWFAGNCEGRQLGRGV